MTGFKSFADNTFGRVAGPVGVGPLVLTMTGFMSMAARMTGFPTGPGAGDSGWTDRIDGRTSTTAVVTGWSHVVV